MSFRKIQLKFNLLLEPLAIFTLGRFGKVASVEEKAIALLVRKNRVLGMYKGLLVDLDYVRRGCLFILGSTGLWSSFAHEEFGPAHAVLAIGAALGGLGVESLPFSSTNFFNGSVSDSDAIAHSAREHDQVSLQSLVVSGALRVLAVLEEDGGEFFDRSVNFSSVLDELCRVEIERFISSHKFVGRRIVIHACDASIVVEVAFVVSFALHIVAEIFKVVGVKSQTTAGASSSSASFLVLFGFVHQSTVSIHQNTFEFVKVFVVVLLHFVVKRVELFIHEIWVTSLRVNRKSVSEFIRSSELVDCVFSLNSWVFFNPAPFGLDGDEKRRKNSHVVFVFCAFSSV